jgi:hypothetical protein
MTVWSESYPSAMQFRHHLGFYILHLPRGMAGMNADPSCNRQAIVPTLYTAKLAEVPNRIPVERRVQVSLVSQTSNWVPFLSLVPKAVHICQDMTKPPRIIVGAFSAEYTGTVTSFNPIPIPSKTRQATSWPQC